ncbi:hypothetical protein X975_25285, partial [Stegodyphus mimosarum]
MDYGFVYCHAKNSIGDMREPCVFNVVPTGPPPPLLNCTIINQTLNSLTVTCESSEILKQQLYHLEIYNTKRKEMLFNLTSKEEP